MITPHEQMREIERLADEAFCCTDCEYAQQQFLNIQLMARQALAATPEPAPDVLALLEQAEHQLRSVGYDITANQIRTALAKHRGTS